MAIAARLVRVHGELPELRAPLARLARLQRVARVPAPRIRCARPSSARAARTTRRRACPKAAARSPASAATGWRWTARQTHDVHAHGRRRRRVDRPGAVRATSKHIFQNLGDGTYFHSGLLAIRAAAAAGVNITYKILFNDAVAMTGGQPHRRALTVPQITQQVAAEGAQADRRGHRRAGQVSAATPTSRRASPCAIATSSTPCSASCARSRA